MCLRFDLQLIYALQMLQILDLALIKIAALSFFRRVFCICRPSLLNSIIWGLIFLIIAWAIAFITFYASACGNHPNAAWGGQMEGNVSFARYCLITEPVMQAYAITDFFFDFLVLLVPIPSVAPYIPHSIDRNADNCTKIWTLKTSLARKISITSVFMLALV